jgi:hypothetical protein
MVLMTLDLKHNWLWRQNARERDSSIFFRARAERKKISGLKGLAEQKYPVSNFSL